MLKVNKTKAAIAAAVMGTALFCGTSDGRAYMAVNAVYYESVSLQNDTRLFNVSTTEAAQSFIKNMGSDAISFLSDKSLGKAEKEKKFKNLLDKNFSMSTIGRFVAGSHWNDMDAKQKEEYQKLFNKLIVAIYSERFSNYEGQEFIVDSARVSGATDFIVNSHIVPLSGENIPIKWHVRDKDGRHRIVDVKIRDVSMAISKKSEFSSIIQRGGGDPDVLLKHLRGKVG